jgi:pimeloyl-ACP methyl ester carboxylesterase
MVKTVFRLLFVLLLVSGLPGPAQAEKVSTSSADGLIINAEYVPGNPSLPALVVLHGFLQTREFLSTKNMIEGLSDLGYTVLGPSLSLGVGNRKKSLSCEAIHKHTLQADIEEIDRWVDWLQEKGHKSVVLVGHSWGGQHGLAYVSNYRERPVKALVAVSLVGTRVDASRLETQRESARSLLDSGKADLASYQLSFCKKYTGTASSYLSYAEWDDTRVLESIQASRLPVLAVLGGSDRRVNDDWKRALQAAGAKVSVVPDADHFFSSLHEFDLLDELQLVLENLQAAR